MAQVSRQLIVGRPVTIPEAENDDLIFDIDVVLANEYCKNKEYEKGFEIYERIVRKAYGDIELKNTYMKYLKSYADSLLKDKKFGKALEVYKKLLKQQTLDPHVYKNAAVCLNELGQPHRALRFFEKYEETALDKEEVYKYLADIYYENFKNYEKAIDYYEKLLVKYPEDAHIYNMLGHLYSTYHQDKYEDRQIYYLSKAAELQPNNRVIIKNIAYVLGKFKRWEEADRYYARLQQLNPSHSDLHSYGGYLVSKRDFENGFRFLMHRFAKEDLQENAFPPVFLNKKVRWNEKMDLRGKSVIMHFEQGFGDSIMFIRFLNQLKTMCAKVAVVLQRPLMSLFEGSNLDVEIFADDIPPHYQYDVVIPMMDMPLVCKTTPETIPYPEGYLSVGQKYIDEFRDMHIAKNDKFKIGIAFEGSIMGKETDRDIPLRFMYPLMELPGVEVYCFQVSDPANQMDRVPANLHYTRLGHKLKSFRDTAAGLKCMDVFISSDNGVMNLAGALGIPSICLFNTVNEWRWIDTKGDDVVWYKSVKPIQCPTSRKWDYTIKEAIKIVEKMQLEKLNKKLKMQSSSIKSKNVSPNAAVSLDLVADLLKEEEKETKKSEKKSSPKAKKEETVNETVKEVKPKKASTVKSKETAKKATPKKVEGEAKVTVKKPATKKAATSTKKVVSLESSMKKALEAKEKKTSATKKPTAKPRKKKEE